MTPSSRRFRQPSIGLIQPQIPKRSVDRLPASGASASRDGGKHDVSPSSLTQEKTAEVGSAAAQLQCQKQKQKLQQWEKQKQQKQQESPQIKEDIIISFDPKKFLPRLDPRTSIIFDPKTYCTGLDPGTSIVFDPRNYSPCFYTETKIISDSQDIWGPTQTKPFASENEGAGASFPNKEVGISKSTQVNDKLCGLPDANVSTSPSSRGCRESRGVPSQIFGDSNPFHWERISECSFLTNFEDYSHAIREESDLFDDVEDENQKPPDKFPPSLRRTTITRRKLSFQPNKQPLKQWKTKILKRMQCQKKKQPQKWQSL